MSRAPRSCVDRSISPYSGSLLLIIQMALPDKSLRFATINVRGLAARRKQRQLYRLVIEHDLDIIAIQETKIGSEDETKSMVLPFMSMYYAGVSHAIGQSAGCVLFVRQHPGLEVRGVRSDLAGRMVLCDFRYGSVEWRVICLYAPNLLDERRHFFESVRNYCNVERNLVLMGDFNCVLAARDKSSGTAYRDASTAELRELIDEYGLEDVADCLECDRIVRFTHFQAASHARLDRVYVPAELIALAQEYRVQSVSFSDHCLVMFDVNKKAKNRNKFAWELWKLNAKILEDEVYCEKVLALLEEIKNQTNTTICEKWETFKQTAKLKALERASALKHEKNKYEENLRQSLQMLTYEESLSPGTFKDDINTLKQKLEQADIERYRGALVRARVEATITGEAPTKRALAKEKKWARRNEIHEVEQDGVILYDQSGIEHVFTAFYRKLFARCPVDAEGFETEFMPLMPKIDDSSKEMLERRITADEIAVAIDDLKRGKSPGPDGLGADFYKAFKYEVAPILAAILDDAYERKRLPPSFLSTHTVLIPKTDDRDTLKRVTAYRPISLANVDYKIFMKVLAKRLQTVVKDIVGPHQTCGIKERTIFTNIHTARSILECCDVLCKKVAMLQLDLEKAFDRVPHDILFAILEYVNVGSVIMEGVAMAYRGCTTRLIINKSVGELIEVQRSVRQGCPLSPLLFALYIEPLCLSVIRANCINGFKMQQAEVKLLAYADDIAVFCGDHASIMKTVEIVKRYCVTSGSAVNWGKSLGIWHGAWTMKPSTFANIQWISTPTKYLGVPLEFYRDSEPYWQNQVAEMRGRTERTKGSELSMFARTTVCNVFFITKLWYVLSVLHCSRINIQKLHRILAVFVWGSSWERTSRTNLFRRVRHGGLSLSHLFLRQIVNRFCFLRDVKDPFLRTVLQLRLCKLVPDFVVSTECIEGGVFGFLKEVVMAYKFLRARFSCEYLAGVKRRKLYKDLVDILLPVPLYRTIYSAKSGSDVLKRVKHMYVAPGAKSFFFRLHTGTLEVKTWLQEKGMYVPWGVHCFLCRKPETIEHVFLECWEGVFFWDILQRTLKKDLPLDPQGIRFLTVDNEEGVPFDAVMLLGLHCIWKACMAARHVDIDARSAQEYFRESVGRFLEAHKSLDPIPEWVSRIEPLMNMRRF